MTAWGLGLLLRYSSGSHAASDEALAFWPASWTSERLLT
jgi:hypothetical protein